VWQKRYKVAQIQKPGTAEGVRDYGPEQVRKRNFIFSTIRTVFEKFGFQPLETPAIENLSTLTGKYGDEGDKLLFKVLNNGDFLKDAKADTLNARDSNALVYQISKRGLRYDLTVPFARYVVMNQHALTFPFKRYQIQPVWRADRPQKGRYREFYQCDADVIGSESLLYEAELVQIYDEAFAALGIPVNIKLNNRKILFGIAESAGIADQFMTMTVAIDKLDKVGMDGVRKELSERGITDAQIAQITTVLGCKTVAELKPLMQNSPTALLGIAEMEQVYALLESVKLSNEVSFDITLARGLSYYTGCILEVAAKTYQIGSIGGGGRYADLTGVFGMPGLSGVGISFGADRIFDVMEGNQLWPEGLTQAMPLLFVAMDAESFSYAWKCLDSVRKAGYTAELYPEPAKMKKQLDYANKRNIPMVAIIGEAERTSGQLTVKNMLEGTQSTMTLEGLIEQLK
jgi:histidyl-tRNA synthetase